MIATKKMRNPLDIIGIWVWVWVNTYRYIFSGMNIHLPAILGFTRYQGFDPSPYLSIFFGEPYATPKGSCATFSHVSAPWPNKGANFLKSFKIDTTEENRNRQHLRNPPSSV